MTPPGTSRPRSPWNRLLVAGKVLLAASLVAWLLITGRLDLAVYRGLLQGPAPGLLAAAFLAQALAFAVFIARWHGLVRVQQLNLSWNDVMRTGAQGLFTQLFVPGGLGTDGIRLLHVHQRHPGRLAAGVSSVLADRVVGLVSLLVLGLGAAALDVSMHGPALEPLVMLSAVVLLSGGLLLAVVLSLGRLTAGRLGRLQTRVAPLAEALRLYTRHPRAVLASLVISVGGHLLTCLATALCLRALGAQDLPWSGLVAITCSVNLIRMLPLTPMGLGVTDGAAEALFALIGLSLGAEQQMLQRAMAALLFLVCGLAFFGRDRRGEGSVADEEPRSR